MSNACIGISSFGFRPPRRSRAKAGHFFVIRNSSFGIGDIFYSMSNRAAALFMKILFGTAGHVHVLRGEIASRPGAFLLASNHISHFDPFIISGVVRRKIDWMAMAEFFPYPIIGFFLRAVDAFPADRDRANRATIRTALERLEAGRMVGLFPEGGIRDGARSILEGAALRPGVSTLAHLAKVPIIPCVILGSDRYYGKRAWLPLRRTPVWIAFGEPITPAPGLEKSAARTRLEQKLAAAMQSLYLELRQKFLLSVDDLPHSPRERLKGAPKNLSRPNLFRSLPIRIAARATDSFMCRSMNFIQSRHRLQGRPREEMERYIVACEKMTAHDFYAVPPNGNLGRSITDTFGATVTWRSPIDTKFPDNDTARADLFPCSRGWSAPTVFMLHALMSVRDNGYRRCAARFNELGWNACFVHLPYHYSRVPRGYWNGELAISADLIRNAEGLRQGVIELRQLMSALREHGCTEFGILGSSYGGWIGALLAMVERDFRFLALMAPIVNVQHAVWESAGTAFMRRELQRTQVEPSLLARHYHLSSPLHNEPLCAADRILFVAGDFDSISPPADIEAIQQKWRGSQLLRVPQGHFGYRMMRHTMAHLQKNALT